MRPKLLDRKDDAEWEAAQAALFAARKMPRGTERTEALRKAGQLRFEADKRRRQREEQTE